MNNDEFFTATTELQTIHQWARARYAAPWAVFGAVLLRVAASTGPHVQLPAIIGGRASLNMMAVFVAPSGGGKGVSDAVARLAWPADIHEEGLGSGQGIAELFKQTKDSQDRIDRAIFSVSEIDHLTSLHEGKANNTRATLKAAVMGERIGGKGASVATSRAVPQHSYRMCLSVGGQPGHCGVILDDSSGGMPQRVLWMPSTDPTMPSERTADPDPLNHRLPGLLTRVHDDSSIVTEIIYGTEDIADTMIAARLAHARGEGDPLDGHKALTRAKVAATLAIMAHRTVVSELDWQLAGHVMDISNMTRDGLIEHARQAARAKVRERAMSRAAGEQFISDHKLDRAKKAVLRWLDRDGETAANQVRSKLKADLRDHFGAAVAELAADGQIVEIQVERGTRYRLSAQVQGVPQVQGTSTQLREGVPDVQGVPEGEQTELENTSSQSPGAQPATPASEPTPAPEETLKPPRPTTCERCYVQLPAAATAALCDDCDGAPAPNAAHDRPTTAHAKAEQDRSALRVVHDGNHAEGTSTTAAQNRTARKQQRRGESA
ncbi:hypothetical protein [Mycobacteroides abscessus]|uniref:hypothetical protein n=1 Tax=Mycobacteroides abscessus TaxID=36809 RepID=UPI000C266CDB|nr:hypothetical protein [Mycobacteroides abscessus]